MLLRTQKASTFRLFLYLEWFFGFRAVSFSFAALQMLDLANVRKLAVGREDSAMQGMVSNRVDWLVAI